MVLVVGAAHPFAQAPAHGRAHKQPMVLLPAHFATRGMLDGCFARCGAEPLVAAEMNTIAPMIGLVARTPLAAIVSRHAVPPRDDIRVVPLEGPTPMRAPGLLWKREARQTAAVRSFAAEILNLALNRSLRAGG
jgi:LysR family cyn operon transcriptional activator